MGGVVAAALGGGASASNAESVTTRGGELVAREAPGNGAAGIAVLRGSDRVQFMGEREGWSEILLPDGRRAWVPSTELTHLADAPLVRSQHPTESPVPLPQNTPIVVSSDPDRTTQALTTEVTRLRGLVDELTTWRASLPERADPPLASSDNVPWMIAGVALVLGLLIGGAWERRRNRRDRSLKF